MDLATHSLKPERSRTLLLLYLLIFFVCLSIPITLLLTKFYQKLKDEEFAKVQYLIEERITGVSETLNQALRLEKNRSAELYEYIPAASKSGLLEVSPLARVPPVRTLPGLIGYFEVDRFGRFRSPVLPRISFNLNDSIPDNLILGGDDALRKRISFFNSLRELLNEESFTEPAVSNNFAYQLSTPSLKEAKKIFRNYRDLHLDVDIEKFAKGFDDFEEMLDIGLELTFRYLDGQNRLVDLRPQEKAEGRFGFKAKGSKVWSLERTVKKAGENYLQGLMLNTKAFSGELLAQLMINLPSNLPLEFRIQYRNEVVNAKRFGISPESEESSLKYKKLALTSLPAPLDSIFISAYSPELPLSPNASILLYTLGLATLFVALVGMFALYNLGQAQIDFAKTRQDFLSAVAHELRTPLTSIRMYSEMLEDNYSVDEDSRKAYLSRILSESERLSRLINDVLAFSRSEHEASLTRFELSPEIEKIIERVELLLKKAEFELNVRGLENLKTSQFNIVGDKDWLSSIFTNILENALKFSKEAEKKAIDLSIEISTSPKDKGRSVIIEIRDYGPGIPSESKKKVFGLFYRVEDEMTRKTRGTGLGLALVSQLLEQMGGKISLNNREPGLAVKVELVEG